MVVIVAKTYQSLVSTLCSPGDVASPGLHPQVEAARFEPLIAARTSSPKTTPQPRVAHRDLHLREARILGVGSKVNVGRFRQAERTMWSSFGLEPVGHWLRLDRSRAEVRVLEVGEGPAVVFVHGASNGATSWVSLAARLPGFRYLLLDCPE